MKPLILLVEDDSEMRNVTRIILNRAGYQVIDVGSAEEALKIVFQESPNLLVADIRLPGISGVKLCEILRNDQRTRTVPVLLLTSLLKTEDKVEGLQTGADDYMTKPYEASEFLARVASLLRRTGRSFVLSEAPPATRPSVDQKSQQEEADYFKSSDRRCFRVVLSDLFSTFRRFLNLPMLWVLLRETMGQRRLRREPEPDLVMEDSTEVVAYATAGRREGGFRAVYLHHAARISLAIQGCSRVVDLACGPATQLAEVAQLNPDISFVGVDMSDSMLDQARAYIQGRGLTNVTFQKSDVTQLGIFEEGSVDGVISTVALHHLPTREHLKDCFREIRRILKPGGAIFLADLGRLKSLKSVLYFAYKEEKTQPYLFNLDFERSLRASFSLKDFQVLTRECLPASAQVYSTHGVPLFIFVKTPDRPLPPVLSTNLRLQRAALPRKFRRDLDDMVFFFRMGGLKNNPFN
ncbi:MAG: response regulator [Elusimicrobia bacterium]|jgi:arsenite methyltransferase|nr:response regulator [Elusimicrobiota bacterium]